MDVDEYKHNYEGFYKKMSYQMSINRGRMTITQGAHASLVGILSFLLFLSWWRASKRRSSYPETVWIPLEANHFNISRTHSRKPWKYVFSYILDDRIICSWWLDVLNIWFNLFHYIRCFDQNFESLSTSSRWNSLVCFLMQDAVVKTLVPDQWLWGWLRIACQP